MKGVIAGVVDLRRRPKFRSERISQLIYGEGVRVTGSEGGYLKVVGADNLEGYMQKSLVGELDDERVYKLSSKHAAVGLQFPFGSFLSEAEAKNFRIPRRLLVPVDRKSKPTELARRFLGVPYLWGGTSDFGFDCSGFTQRLFRYSGIEIPRNSNWQRDAGGSKVKDLDHALAGDLVFFSGHVALHLGRDVIISANLSHGGVTTTDLSDGSGYSNYLLSNLQGVRRFEAGSYISSTGPGGSSRASVNRS